MKKQLAVLLVITAFVSITESDGEELDFFDPNANREEVNEQISDKFWNNPFDVPIFLVLIGISIGIFFFVWKRKWHIHSEK